MIRLLHVIASPRGDDSRTLRISRALVQAFKEKVPALEVDQMDLSEEALPAINAGRIRGKYALLSGAELDVKASADWMAIESHIRRFLSADVYLLSAPMWNFGIPYLLKHYIDVIVQPRYLFRYTGKGPEGLLCDKRMAVVTSRGGDYSPGTAFAAMDFTEPYLRAVFGFTGVKDISFLHAQGLDACGDSEREAKIIAAEEEAGKIAKHWAESMGG